MDIIIEWIFMQFTFNILGMTLTQKMITGRASKIHKWIWGDMYKRRKVSLTMTSERYNYWVNSYAIHIQHFMSDSNSENNNFYGFENSQMDMREFIWVGESSLSHDKWQIKLLSEFLCNSLQHFTNYSNSKNDNW